MNILTPDTSESNDYLREIASLGDRKRIIATKDIETLNGIKLIAKGAAVNSELIDKILHHKIAPIDNSLAIENAVTPASVLAEIKDLDSPTYPPRKVVSFFQFSTLNLLEKTLSELPLSHALSFKLTIMRESRPALYLQSIRVATMAFLLAQLDPSMKVMHSHALAAGLFHDIGMLHIDPRLLETDALSDPQVRQHIYAHPITTHMLLKKESHWDGIVAEAVLEHHERIDGSGYPRGLTGDKLSRLGQLLSSAELAASMHAKQFMSGTSPRLASIVLRFSYGKFSPLYLGIAHDIVSRVPRMADISPTLSAEACFEKLGNIADCISGWYVAKGSPESPFNQPHDEMTDFFDDQISLLKRNLAIVGIDIQNIESVRHDIGADPDSLSLTELEIIVSESARQVRLISWEAQRRQATKLAKTGFESKALASWLQITTEKLAQETNVI